MSETMHRSRTSPTQRVRARASAIGPGSNDRCELANSDPEANCRSAPSILTLTLELVALFLVISFRRGIARNALRMAQSSERALH
jgi:hypothetical protein